MYIAAGQGQTTPGDKILMSTETSCHFGHLLQVKKKISLKTDFIHFFFHDFIHIYSPRAGADNRLGTDFWCQHLFTPVICCKFQKNLFEVWFYAFFFFFFFFDFIHVYSPGSGADSPRGQMFDVNRNVLSLHSSVASFKRMSLKSDSNALANITRRLIG